MPRDDVDGTFTVRVEVVVAGLGLKFAVAPAGRPLTVRLTGELNPLVCVMVVV